MTLNQVEIRFYEELNDFLPTEKKKSSFPYTFKGNSSVKDAIESLGVPHTEVDLILVNSKSVRFSHGYWWIRTCFPKKQLQEVILRFDLYSFIIPFHRCIVCNGIIKEIPKELIMDRLLPKTKKYYNNFFQCEYCRKIYWKGSHYLKMKEFAKKIIKNRFFDYLL